MTNLTSLQIRQTSMIELLFENNVDSHIDTLMNKDGMQTTALSPYQSSSPLPFTYSLKPPVTTASIYNRPHHVLHKFKHNHVMETSPFLFTQYHDFDIVQHQQEPTSPVLSISTASKSNRPLSSQSTLCSITPDVSDSEWKKQFQALISTLVNHADQVETLSVDLLRIEVKVRELVLLEKALAEQLEEQEQFYLNKIEECLDVYQQQANLIQQLTDLEHELEVSHMDKIDLLRLKVSLFMGGSAGTGKVLHSFESPVQGLQEYIIGGSGTTSSQTHIKFYKHQYLLHINHEDQKKFKLLPKYLWTPDHQSNTCQFKACLLQFNLFNRRHHCRRCGILVCQRHSLNRLPLFSKENKTASQWCRVCDGCFYNLIIMRKSPDSALQLSTLT